MDAPQIRRHAVAPALAAGLALALVPLVGCDAETLGGPDPRPAALGFSKAYGLWTPGPGDTCSREVRDGYSTVGPDGLGYPTWHPPVDAASGCTFGHERGRDPSGPRLFAEVGPIPFGYANSALNVWNPHGMRHEDHVGHKIEWENDMEMRLPGAASAVLSVRCDVLTKLHQGSHSKDAFTNNLHELVYHIRCTDGTAFHVTLMAAIGKAGEFVASCDGRTVVAGTPTPPNSPDGGGKRRIPDRACVERSVLVGPGERSEFGILRESWETSNRIRKADGKTLVSFNPYYQVFLPSRFHDPALPASVGRPIDVCYEVTPTGRRAVGGPCDESTGRGTIPEVGFDHPVSRFNGVRRLVDINSNRVSKAGGPEVWYTDPFGQNGRPEAFPGSIRQRIARIDNTGMDLHGPVIGRHREHGGPGVHAPN